MPRPACAAARRQALLLGLARLIAPLAPHLAEECSTCCDPAAPLVAELPWPEADPAMLAVETVTVAVQVNGKLRGTVDAAARHARPSTAYAAAAAEPNVARLIDGKRMVKRIHVPDRIVNFVVAG